MKRQYIVPERGAQESAQRMLDELVRIRDSTFCQATSADLNGDICQVTFTCAGCRRRAELTRLIDDVSDPRPSSSDRPDRAG